MTRNIGFSLWEHLKRVLFQATGAALPNGSSQGDLLLGVMTIVLVTEPRVHPPLPIERAVCLAIGRTLQSLKEPLAIFTRKDADFFYQSRGLFGRNRFFTPQKRNITVFCYKLIDVFFA